MLDSVEVPPSLSAAQTLVSTMDSVLRIQAHHMGTLALVKRDTGVLFRIVFVIFLWVIQAAGYFSGLSDMRKMVIFLILVGIVISPYMNRFSGI